jgi:hypothetical protein
MYYANFALITGCKKTDALQNCKPNGKCTENANLEMALPIMEGIKLA